MVRALVQPLGGTPASAGAGLARRSSPGTACPRAVGGGSATRSRGIRPGFGLLIGAGVSLGLWAGLAELALMLLR